MPRPQGLTLPIADLQRYRQLSEWCRERGIQISGPSSESRRLRGEYLGISQETVDALRERLHEHERKTGESSDPARVLLLGALLLPDALRLLQQYIDWRREACRSMVRTYRIARGEDGVPHREPITYELPEEQLEEVRRLSALHSDVAELREELAAIGDEGLLAWIDGDDARQLQASVATDPALQSLLGALAETSGEYWGLVVQLDSDGLGARDELRKLEADLTLAGHDVSDAGLAVMRVLQPLLESGETGFIERHWSELTPRERARFVHAGVTRERIMFNRSPARLRAQRLAAGEPPESAQGGSARARARQSA